MRETVRVRSVRNLIKFMQVSYCVYFSILPAFKVSSIISVNLKIRIRKEEIKFFRCIREKQKYDLKTDLKEL